MADWLRRVATTEDAAAAGQGEPYRNPTEYDVKFEDENWDETQAEIAAANGPWPEYQDAPDSGVDDAEGDNVADYAPPRDGMPGVSVWKGPL